MGAVPLELEISGNMVHIGRFASSIPPSGFFKSPLFSLSLSRRSKEGGHHYASYPLVGQLLVPGFALRPLIGEGTCTVPAASRSVNFVTGLGLIFGSVVGICFVGQWGVHASPVHRACMCSVGFSRLCSFVVDVRHSVCWITICEKVGSFFSV